MTGLPELLEAPDLRPMLRHLAGPLSDRPVGSVAIVEDLDRLARAPAGAMGLLTEGASRSAVGDVVVPVRLDGEPDATLCVAAHGGHADVVAEAAARLTAAGMARAHQAARQAEEVPVRSRGELLTEFLFAGPDRADRLLERL